MCRSMLGKVAKAHATRTSYPETGGLLIPEETHSRQFTDYAGRPDHNGSAPRSPRAPEAVADRKIAEAKQRTGGDGAGQPVRAGTEAPRPTQTGGQRQDGTVQPEPRTASAAAPRPDPTPARQKIINVTVPSESAEWAYIEGDIAEMVPWIQNELKGVWSDGKKLWQIPVERIPDVQAACAAAKYRFHQETMPVAPNTGHQRPHRCHRMHADRWRHPRPTFLRTTRQRPRPAAAVPSPTPTG